MNVYRIVIKLTISFGLLFPALSTAEIDSLHSPEHEAALSNSTSKNNKKNNSDAAAKIPKLPKEMMYQGKPIDALCIDKLMESDDKKAKIELKQCSGTSHHYKIEETDKELTQKGFIGLSYSSKKGEDGEWGGYAYYKYLGKHNDDMIIYFLRNTGGSGMMSNIFLVKREGDTLQLTDNLVGGDRCNGGLEKAYYENNQLFYTVSLTPYDYIPLSKEKLQVAAYDDLASCAVCCQGSAEFSYDFKENRLIAVNLGDLPNGDATTQGKYQVCFNRLIADKINSGKQKLTPEELTQFVQEFKSKCMKQ